MSDLIDRQAAIDAIVKHSYAVRYDYNFTSIENGMTVTGIKQALGELPSAQPERKTGRWEITDAYPHNVYCSECHKKFAQAHWEVWEDGSLPRNYCPNCGAKMGGEDNETD